MMMHLLLSSMLDFYFPFFFHSFWIIGLFSLAPFSYFFKLQGSMKSPKQSIFWLTYFLLKKKVLRTNWNTGIAPQPQTNSQSNTEIICDFLKTMWYKMWTQSLLQGKSLAWNPLHLLYVCVYIYMCVCVCVYIYTHTQYLYRYRYIHTSIIYSIYMCVCVYVTLYIYRDIYIESGGEEGRKEREEINLSLPAGGLGR